MGPSTGMLSTLTATADQGVATPPTSCHDPPNDREGSMPAVAATGRQGQDARVIPRPETRYARSGDVMVAYQVTGEDHAVDLVHAVDWSRTSPCSGTSPGPHG